MPRWVIRPADEIIKGLRGAQSAKREDIVAAMQQDAQRALKEPGCMKELLNKYFAKVEVGDEEITIHAVCDLGEYGDKEKVLEKFSKALTTNGCGGAQHVVVKYVIPRPRRSA